MPITPVFEQPPTPVHTKGIDWTATVAALVEHPGEWAKVDGPFPDDKKGRSNLGNHVKSLLKFGARGGHTIETQRGLRDGQNWIYARLVPDAKPKAQAKPEPAPKAERPVAAVPDPPRSPAMDDLDDDALTCDLCGDRFRTNTRLSQHQANAHKAS